MINLAYIYLTDYSSVFIVQRRLRQLDMKIIAAKISEKYPAFAVLHLIKYNFFFFALGR